MSDLEEFFNKVGTAHAYGLRVCNRGCGPHQDWYCECIVTEDPNLHSFPCTNPECRYRIVICDCEMAHHNGAEPNFCMLGEGEYGCKHQPDGEQATIVTPKD